MINLPPLLFMLENLKLNKATYGANTVISVESPEYENVEHFFNGIYNNGGVPEIGRLDIIYQSDIKTVGSFQVNEKKFIKSLANWIIVDKLHELTKDNNVRITKGEMKNIKKLAKEKAINIYESIEYDSSLALNYSRNDIQEFNAFAHIISYYGNHAKYSY